KGTAGVKRKLGLVDYLAGDMGKQVSFRDEVLLPIAQSKVCIRNGVRWKVGNGLQISLWYDWWVGSGPFDRQGNRSADCLASLAQDSGMGVTFLDSPPPALLPLWTADLLGESST
ncbi:LINE-type retrotransposon LIb DNA, partial [Striga asiatica]